jgi:hypothetical protein
MPAFAVYGIVAAHAAVAVLLLSLNLTSLWRWQIKAGAIVMTVGMFVAVYLTVDAMLGWPSANRLPERASYLASRIVEPDPISGEPGIIFVWLQSIDDRNLPVGEPRAYKVAYDRAVAEEVVRAQRLRFTGHDVVGSFEYANRHPDDQRDGVPSLGQPTTDVANLDQRPAGAGGMFSLNQDLRAIFEELPPLPLPDKVPFVNEEF